MSTVLEVKNLVKHFQEVKAVDGVSFAIESGTCFGLLGPNGAGKTSLLKVLLGELEADSGNLRLGNVAHPPLAVHQHRVAPVGQQRKR